MLHISKTNSLSRRIIISKWWNNSLPYSLEYIYIRGRQLIKDGVGSGLTAGLILEEGYQSMSFYILGNELCPFAVAGDSGSLVCIQETMEVVGMVIMTELYEGRQVCQVLPVWQFYDWLNDNVSQIRNLEFMI